jgi:DNA polymerase-1
MPRRILLLDSLNLISRAFYAIPVQYAKDQTPINAIRGWFNTVWKLRDEYQPDQILACFDGGTPPWRRELAPTYKTNRTEKPADLVIQIQLIEEICPLMGISPIKHADTEADDLLGSFAKLGEKLGHSILLASGDKDLVQCVTENVTLLRPPKKLGENWERYDNSNAHTLLNVRPDQVADYLALTGDTADCLPGIPKVGEKTAAKWLKEHGSVTQLLLNPPGLTGQAAKNLAENHELLIKNRMVTSLDHIPVELPEPIQEQTELLKARLESLSLWRVLQKLAPTPQKPPTEADLFSNQ